MKNLLPLLLLVSLSVNAQTYYISPAGNDANPGTLASPWKTLSKATSTVTIGVISVLSGTYTETSTCSLKAGVSIKGENKSTTIIKSAVTGQWVSFLELQSPDNTNGNQSISGLTLDGQANTTGNQSGTGVGIWITGRSNVSVHDVKLQNFFMSGTIFAGNQLDGITAKNWTSGPYATGNSFYNNESVNCAAIDGGTGQGSLMIGWQDGMDIHDNNLNTTARPLSRNGWPIKYLSNGYLKGVKIHDNTLIKSPFQGTTPFSPPNWDFALEFFNVQGMQLYNNYIQGAADFSYVYKGSYPYGLWAYNNTFNNPNQNYSFVESGFIFEFKADHIIVENNVINNKFVGISYNTRGINNNGGENNYACTYGGSTGGCSGIINNVIRNNVFSNLYAGNGASGGIAIQSEATNDVQIDGLYIYNNTFSAKSGGGTYNGLDFGGMGGGANVKNVFIRNNIFQNFRSNPIVKQSGGSQSNVQITNNDFYNNSNNTVSWTGAIQANNQLLNPLFVSPTDFHLQPSSPLIDDGFTPLLLPTYATPVVFTGSAPDIGYSEVGGISPLPCTGFTFGAWTTCDNTGNQTRTWSGLPAGCTGTPPPDSISRICTPIPIPCTGYVYSNYGPCINNVQTRTVTGYTPSGCTGTPLTPPVLTQACIPPIQGDTILTSTILRLPATGNGLPLRNLIYIVKRADGKWYTNGNVQVDVIMYKNDLTGKWIIPE